MIGNISVQEQKARLRGEVLSQREAQTDKDALSRRILERVFSLPSYQAAGTVLFYVDVRNEVQTGWVLSEVLAADKRLVVPFCVDRELELFWLQDLKELAKGRFGILEPKPELRTLPDRRISPEELDFLVVPGVAFDRHGGRMGHGFGFYDHLLSQIPPGVPKIGLGFECQMLPRVPTEPHDVPLDTIVTEAAVYSSGTAPC